MATPPRKTERFQRVPIFSQYLSKDEVSEILQITDEFTVPEGTVIFNPGDENDGFYIILSGRVDINIPNESGEGTTIATLSNRSVFGEMSFLGDRKRSAWAVAKSTTRLDKIRATEFRQLLESGNLAAYKVIHNFAKLISMRLRRVEDELLGALDELAPQSRQTKLAELQQFREKLFREWSF